MFKKILVGFDGSEESWKALHCAMALAKREHGCELWALSVEERLPRMPEVIDELAEEKERQNRVFYALHRQAQALAVENGVNLELRIVAGHAAQEIVNFAEQGKFDLLVIGHSGHSRVWGRFLGDAASKIVSHARCSVLVVR